MKSRADNYIQYINVIWNSIVDGHRLQIMGYFAVVLTVFLLGYFLNIWSTNLLGDDSYLDAAFINFFAKYFPDVNWLPNWYAGLSGLLTLRGIRYPLLGGFALFTGLDGATVVIISFFVSITLFAVFLYHLAIKLDYHPFAAFAFSILPLSTPGFWNWSIRGGAYSRIGALPFLILSILLAMPLKKGKKISLHRFFSIILCLSFTAALHPYIGGFAFSTVILFFLLTESSCRRRIGLAGAISAFGLGLTAWLYFPVFFSTASGWAFHYSELMRWEWLIFPQIGNELTLNPLFIGLMIVSACIGIHHLIKSKQLIAPKDSMFLTIFIHVLFFFAQGWLPIPYSVRIFSSYDALTWIAVFGTITVIFGFSHSESLSPILSDKLFTGKILVLLVLIQAISIYPILGTIGTYENPNDPITSGYLVQEASGSLPDGYEERYRLATGARVASRSLLFTNPSLFITGGRWPGQQPNKYFQDSLKFSVFYRKDPQSSERLFVEERMHSVTEEIRKNLQTNSALYFLHWYGVGASLNMPSWTFNDKTIADDRHKPHLFNTYTIEGLAGNAVISMLNDPLPLASATNQTPVGVIVTSPQEKEAYEELMLIASYGGLDSRWFLPIQLSDADINSGKCSEFPLTIVFEQDEGTKNEFTENSGELDNKGEPASWKSLSLSTLDAHEKLGSPESSFSLINDLDPNFLTETESLNLKDVQISYTSSSETFGYVSYSSITTNTTRTRQTKINRVSYQTADVEGNITTAESAQVLEIEFAPGNIHRQIQFQGSITANLSMIGQVEIDLQLVQGSANIDLVMEGSQEQWAYRSLPQLPLKKWVHLSIPYSTLLHNDGSFSDANSLTIVFNLDRPTLQTEKIVLLVRNITVTEFSAPPMIQLSAQNFGESNRYQTNFIIGLFKPIDLSLPGWIKVDYSSDQRDRSIDIVLKSSDEDEFIFHELSTELETNKTIILPFSEFRSKNIEAEMFSSFDQIELILHGDNSSMEFPNILLKSVQVVFASPSQESIPIMTKFVDPSTIHLNLNSTAYRGILLRTTYYPQMLVRVDGGPSLTVYYAGPGLSYISLDDLETEYDHNPLTIIVDYGVLQPIQTTALIITITSFFIFVILWLVLSYLKVTGYRGVDLRVWVDSIDRNRDSEK